MNFKFLLGLAAGVGVTYWLTSPSGKRWVESIGQRVADTLTQGEDLLIDATDGLEIAREKIVEKTKQPVLS